MCEYPKRILPKREYVRRIDVDDLKEKCQQALLARRLDGGENHFHYIGGRKILNEGVINEDVLNWSTNLLGGEFKTEDVCWRQKNEGSKEWNDETVDLCNYGGCYELTISADCVFITISCLHKTIIPYKRKFGSRDDLRQYAENTSDITKDVVEQWNAKDELDCRASIIVGHSPTMLNYWHMTIDITPKDFAEPMPRDGKKNKGLRRKVREALHMHILNNILCEEPHVEGIPEDLYIRQ